MCMERDRAAFVSDQPQSTESEWAWLTFTEHVSLPGTMLSSKHLIVINLSQGEYFYPLLTDKEMKVRM